jgi:hypothetical protein
VKQIRRRLAEVSTLPPLGLPHCHGAAFFAWHRCREGLYFGRSLRPNDAFINNTGPSRAMPMRLGSTLAIVFVAAFGMIPQANASEGTGDDACNPLVSENFNSIVCTQATQWHSVGLAAGARNGVDFRCELIIDSPADRPNLCVVAFWSMSYAGECGTVAGKYKCRNDASIHWEGRDETFNGFQVYANYYYLFGPIYENDECEALAFDINAIGPSGTRCSTPGRTASNEWCEPGNVGDIKTVAQIMSDIWGAGGFSLDSGSSVCQGA